MKSLKILSLLLAAFAVGIIYSSGCGGGVDSSNVPKNLSVEPASTELLISWDGISGASSYNVYWSTSSEITEETGNKIEGVEDTSYVHTGLRNETTYYYIVTGIKNSSESPPSEIADGTPTFSGEKDFEISIPVNVTIADTLTEIDADIDDNIYLLLEIDNPGVIKIYKYDSEGEMYEDYGGTGSITHSTKTGGDGCYATTMIIDNDQNLLLLATCGCTDRDCQEGDRFPSIFRYLPSGELDTSFGNEGRADGDIDHRGRKIALDSDGNIFLSGNTLTPADDHMFVSKYSSAGEELWKFDGDSLQNGTTGDSIMLDSEGNVLVANDNGYEIEGGGGERQFATWKVKNDGSSLLTTFAVNGTLEPSGYQTGGLITSETNDNFVINASTGAGPLEGNQFVLRYNSNGVIDESFGNGAGRIELSEACPVDGVQPLGATEEYGGKLIGAGIVGSLESFNGFVCIFDDTGVLDSSMFENGYYFGPESSFPLNLTTDHLGRVIVVYWIIDTDTEMITDIVVLRYK